MSDVQIGQHRAKKKKAGATLPCGRTFKGPPKKSLSVPPAPKTLAPSPPLYDITIIVHCNREAVSGAKVILNRERVMRTKADGTVCFRKRKRGEYSIEVRFDKGSEYENLNEVVNVSVREDVGKTIKVRKKPNAILAQAKQPKSNIFLENIQIEIGPEKTITTDEKGIAQSSFMDPGIHTVKITVPKPEESKVEVFFNRKLKGNFAPGNEISFPIRLERGDIDKKLIILITPYQWVELEFVDSKDPSKPIKGVGACVILPNGEKKVKNSRSNGIAKIEYSVKGKIQIERIIDNTKGDFPDYMLEAELEG